MTAAASRSIRPHRRILVQALGVALGALLCGAPAALADSATSANWAGYAVHRTGVHFRSVTAEWRIPSPSCTPGAPGYSSAWVGLGGYSGGSNALEQTGVEVDCSSSGQGTYFAWYELVPAQPGAIPRTVRAGDLIRATVTASGRRVTISFANLTRGRRFQKSFHPGQLDTTAADWIVEAPSECTNAGQCFTLPLADFGRVSFQAARATAPQGDRGAISSPRWGRTKISLVPDSARLFAGTDGGVAGAIPSALMTGGSAFTVSFEPLSHPSTTLGSSVPARGSHLVVGHLIHPTR